MSLLSQILIFFKGTHYLAITIKQDAQLSVRNKRCAEREKESREDVRQHTFVLKSALQRDFCTPESCSHG